MLNNLGGSQLGFRNRLLALAPDSELQRFQESFETVTLTPRDILLRPDQMVGGVMFVETGVVSMIAHLEDGTRIEVGVAGPEGMIGLPLLLGAKLSAVEAMVQARGTGLRLPAATFVAMLKQAPVLQKAMLRYVDTFQAQVQQSAACNARHRIEQRLARWLLTMHDRVEGDSFVMTHEFMSALLGVRRPGVTLAIGALQRAGLLRHERGRVTLIDRPGLQQVTCECYETVRRRFAWLVDAKEA